LRLQLAGEGDDIVGCNRRDPAAPKPREQVQPELRAIEVERAVGSRSDRDFGLELGQPASRVSAKVTRGDKGSPSNAPSVRRSSRCLQASPRVTASRVRKRGRPATITQTAYLPFVCI
jgi:hypothetical protein